MGSLSWKGAGGIKYRKKGDNEHKIYARTVGYFTVLVNFVQSFFLFCAFIFLFTMSRRLSFTDSAFYSLTVDTRLQVVPCRNPRAFKQRRRPVRPSNNWIRSRFYKCRVERSIHKHLQSGDLYEALKALKLRQQSTVHHGFWALSMTRNAVRVCMELLPVPFGTAECGVAPPDNQQFEDAFRFFWHTPSERVFLTSLFFAAQQLPTGDCAAQFLSSRNIANFIDPTDAIQHLPPETHPNFGAAVDTLVKSLAHSTITSNEIVQSLLLRFTPGFQPDLVLGTMPIFQDRYVGKLPTELFSDTALAEPRLQRALATFANSAQVRLLAAASKGCSVYWELLTRNPMHLNEYLLQVPDDRTLRARRFLDTSQNSPDDIRTIIDYAIHCFTLVRQYEAAGALMVTLLCDPNWVRTPLEETAQLRHVLEACVRNDIRSAWQPLADVFSAEQFIQALSEVKFVGTWNMPLVVAKVLFGRKIRLDKALATFEESQRMRIQTCARLVSRSCSKAHVAHVFKRTDFLRDFCGLSLDILWNEVRTNQVFGLLQTYVREMEASTFPSHQRELNEPLVERVEEYKDALVSTDIPPACVAEILESVFAAPLP